MDLRPQLQIKTAIKAMTDVVLPAVDKDNKLAQEQANLVVSMLNIAVNRMHLSYRYDRDELSRSLTLAETLGDLAKDLPGANGELINLKNTAVIGENVLERARAEPTELEMANFEMREKVGALITALYAASKTTDLKQISSAISDHAKEQLLRERAWLIGQGWEADPESIPDIETLIS